MNVIDSLSFVGQDTRVRKYMYPTRLIATLGNVLDADQLLKPKSLQIGLNEPVLTTLENGADGESASVLLDFGVELHGSARLLSYLHEGEQYPQVRLTFGESVSEAMSDIGVKNATNHHSVRDMVVTLPTLSDMEYGQTGFRFLRIQLQSVNTKICIKSALAVFIYRDVEYLGSFSCNDEILTQIYDTAAYTCHLNMQNMLWDGIKRDRLVWIGDMHPEILTIRSVFGRLKIVEESLEFACEQTPLPKWMNGIPSYSMWWLIILWDWYMHNGDSSFLNCYKDYAIALLVQLCELVNEDGSDNLSDYFFDWPTANTDASISGARSVLLMALETGKVMAKFFDNMSISELCEQKRNALRKKEEAHFNAKQTAAFLVLTGVLDAKETTDTVLTKGGAAGMSTFLSYYILKAIDLGGDMTAALQILRTYYGAMLDKGATTFWEDFHMEWLENASRIDEVVPEGKTDIHGDNGAFCYQGFRHSLCHGWSSGPVPFLTERVLGIQIVEPGCRKLRIAPHLGDLDWAKGTFPTPYGVVSVSHVKNADGLVSTTFTVPKEVAICF